MYVCLCILNCHFLSIAFFLNFILLERILILVNFVLKYFLNFNIYYNYFLLKVRIFCLYWALILALRYVGVAIGEMLTL
jgi:hypothetical protein